MKYNQLNFFFVLSIILFISSCAPKPFRSPPQNVTFNNKHNAWSFTGEFALIGDSDNTVSFEEVGEEVYMITSWGNRLKGHRKGNAITVDFNHGGKRHVTINELSDDGRYMRGRMVEGASVYGEAQYIYYVRIGDPVRRGNITSTSSFLADSLDEIPKIKTTIPVQTGESRLALIIGNSDYKVGPLINPVNDARDMSSALRKLGFKILIVINGNKQSMVKKLHEFGEKLKNFDVGLFFYAGHGMQVNGRNYIIPVDAEPNVESEVEFVAVDVGRVLAQMDSAGNSMNIIILDACRNNPFASSFRSGSRGLARMDAPKGSYIAFSTAPGSVSQDGKGKNGIFTMNLLNNLYSPGETIEEIMKKTRIDVVKATEERQVPWESSSLMRNFYFIPEKKK